MKHWSDSLAALDPCADALKWTRTQPDADTAWRTCERGEWMLWLIGSLDKSEPYRDERKPIVRVACECARLAWDRMPQASRDALMVVEQWTRGEVDNEALNTAWAAAGAAARAAAWAAEAAARAAAGAAGAAARAAEDAAGAAAWAAEDAAGAAAGAARAAAWAAEDAARAAARAATQAQCADIVRKHCPTAPRLP